MKFWCFRAPADDNEPRRVTPKPEEKKKNKWWQIRKKKEKQEVCTPADDDELCRVTPKPEEKKKKWWQIRKKKEKQEQMNVEENEMMENEGNEGTSAQVLQEQVQEMKEKVVLVNQVQELEDQVSLENQVQELKVAAQNQVSTSEKQNLDEQNLEKRNLDEQNMVEQNLEEKNPYEQNLKEQNMVTEGIEGPLQAVVLENVFRFSCNEVDQQLQDVQKDHMGEHMRLMETTMENQGVSVPAVAPEPLVSMLKLKRTSPWSVRLIPAVPSSKYVSSALLCSAALWLPADRPGDHLENLEKMKLRTTKRHDDHQTQTFPSLK
ncbi:uncharacterized protein LOC134316364 isoform X2 [Trichomycterus rosablanca]|uniref:uncharacterized protein LOC134316364 isoform X2 n=1 Tax=Trichomycterus rosablanca TaxID=2290929 RepID=UPI002F35BCC8